MIAARLPPYSHIVKRDQGRLEWVAVDEDFITQIREMPAEDLTAIFHGAIGRSGPPGNRHVEPDGADQPSHKTHAHPQGTADAENQPRHRGVLQCHGGRRVGAAASPGVSAQPPEKPLS